MHDVADRLDRLCRLLGGGELARRAREYGVEEPLERLLGAVRAGTDPERVRADLDALDEGFARHGIDGLTTRTRSTVGLKSMSKFVPVTATAVPSASENCWASAVSGVATPVRGLMAYSRTPVPLNVSPYR